jgi:hypothetical protein
MYLQHGDPMGFELMLIQIIIIIVMVDCLF